MRYSYICIFLIYKQPYYSVIKDLKTGSIFSLENRFMASLLFIKILYKKKKRKADSISSLDKWQGEPWNAFSLPIERSIQVSITNGWPMWKHRRDVYLNWNIRIMISVLGQFF